MDNSRTLLNRALEADDLSSIGPLLREHPDLANNDKNRPSLTLARSAAAAQELLKSGADLDAVTKWWAPGFYTQTVAKDVALLLIERGADLTIHAAAGLGLTDRVSHMLATEASLVHAKGGDGCTPLHFARDIEMATLLLDQGAAIDARDEDHESTP